MRLFVLLHSQHADSLGGYEIPLDMTEHICGEDIQDEEQLTSILRREGFVSSPYTYLYGGHHVEKFQCDEDDDSIRQPAILAVPKDPLVKVMCKDHEWMSSVGRYDCTVGDLKVILGQSSSFGSKISSDNLILMPLSGKVLEDQVPLASTGCLNQDPFLCRMQLDEYFTAPVYGSTPSDRMAFGLAAARIVQQDWCDVKEFKTETEQVATFLVDELSSLRKGSKKFFGSEAPLQGFSYDRFVRDFPPENAPDLVDPSALNALKLQLSKLSSQNSACPAQAQRMIERITAQLGRTNADLANGTAHSLATLMEAITNLAVKNPIPYPHEAFHTKLDTIEKSLNRYKDIMAMKMLQRPQDLIERQTTLEILLEEIKTFNGSFAELKSMWDEAELWADLSCFDSVSTDSAAVAQAAIELLATAASSVQAENGRLQTLRQIKEEAAHLDGLIQKQVLWCGEVACAAVNTVDDDLHDIDSQIKALLEKRAAKMVLRDRLAQRVSSLEAHAAVEAARFQAFCSAHDVKEAALRERLRQAELGRAAAELFGSEFGKLQETIATEIAALRVRAHELRADVGADLAWAYRLGHSANYMLDYYEKEHCESLKEEIEKKTRAYQKAVRERRTEVAEELAAAIEKLSEEVSASKAEMEAFRASTALLESQVAPAWGFLCQHAVGGAVSAAGAEQISVRTSEASRALWGGNDRVLSRPEEWNRAMKEEAEKELALLGN